MLIVIIRSSEMGECQWWTDYVASGALFSLAAGAPTAQRKRARLEEKAEEESSLRAKLHVGSAGLGLSAHSMRRLAQHEKSNVPRSTQVSFQTLFPASGSHDLCLS